MSVYAVLSDPKKFLRLKSRADISNTTFKLHKLTTSLLLACSVLTTSKQLFGDPIHCVAPGRIPTPVFQSYCFMTGTYTVNRSKHEAQVEVAHPGVMQGSGPADPRNQFHTYYQWVCLLLVLQAGLSYLPYHVWKMAEGGRVSRLLVKVSNALITETSLEDQVSGLADFLTRHSGWFNFCSLKLLLCQLGCLVSTVTQIYLMDLVLGNHFLSLGSSLTDLSGIQQSLTVVFPKVVKCSMNSYGPSGSLVPQHGLCTLPINIVNEKIYLVLWVWFLCLALVSLLQLVHSLLLLLVPSLRYHQLRSHCPALHPRLLLQVVRRATYGDTVLLHLLANNCDTAQFTALLSSLVSDESEETSTEDSHVAYEELGEDLARRKRVGVFAGDHKMIERV